MDTRYSHRVRSVCHVFVAGLALVALCCTGRSSRAADTSDWKPLFDGKTFDGWEGNMKSFRIEDGAIVGGSLKEKVPRNEFLATTKDYDNFELKLKFKLIGKGANGGVQFRSRRIPNNHEMVGYQADLGDGYWGSLYDESRRKKTLIKPSDETIKTALKHDDWNDYRILADGLHIQLWINGIQTVDYTEADATLEQTGLIGLQIHGGGPSEAWYKDLEIRQIPKGETKSTTK